MLKVVRHVGRVAMHRHVHGHIDTHAGEHVVVLGGWLDSSCSTGTEHSALVLRPGAVLRGTVASTRRHHLQQADHVECRTWIFASFISVSYYYFHFHTASYTLVTEASFPGRKAARAGCYLSAPQSSKLSEWSFTPLLPTSSWHVKHGMNLCLLLLLLLLSILLFFHYYCR